MDISKFIELFADQFDETDASEFTHATEYRALDEWSSLTGLAVLNMIGKKCGVKLTPSEVKDTNTIEELYNLVVSKQ